MRKLIYELVLNIKAGNRVSQSPLFIATNNPDNIPHLIEKNKVFFEQRGEIESWKVVRQIPTIQMSPEKYHEEISFCDIVDETGNETPTKEELKIISKEINSMSNEDVALVELEQSRKLKIVPKGVDVSKIFKD